MLPLPSFYDPKSVPELYMERAALVANEATSFARTHRITPSSKDTKRIAAFGIDCQVGFCTPGASLFVPGAVEDTRRILAFLYGNMDRITGLHFSLDTHRIFQIFHPSWWLREDGTHPEPFSVVTYDDVRSGALRPVAHPAESLEYTKRLAAQGKYVLTIWPYHTLLGGLSHALVPALMEAAIFHAVARQQQTHFETKGTHALTENYSVLSPEVLELGGRPVGTFNAAFFKMLMEYDRVYVFGQAKSHCVLSTLRDMQAHLERTDPELVDKIYVLEDAMSPVPAPSMSPLPPELDFPRVAERAFAELERAGMHIVTTKDAIVI
ncbi:MAG: nicotinamidase [Myxococcales bacterium]|jgi:nicotinamidase-related amidase|nr:nicotinamidase [Myxococcales bacterium]